VRCFLSTITTRHGTCRHGVSIPDQAERSFLGRVRLGFQGSEQYGHTNMKLRWPITAIAYQAGALTWGKRCNIKKRRKKGPQTP